MKLSSGNFGHPFGPKMLLPPQTLTSHFQTLLPPPIAWILKTRRCANPFSFQHVLLNLGDCCLRINNIYPFSSLKFVMVKNASTNEDEPHTQHFFWGGSVQYEQPFTTCKHPTFRTFTMRQIFIMNNFKIVFWNWNAYCTFALFVLLMASCSCSQPAACHVLRIFQCFLFLCLCWDSNCIAMMVSSREQWESKQKAYLRDDATPLWIDAKDFIKCSSGTRCHCLPFLQSLQAPTTMQHGLCQRRAMSGLPLTWKKVRASMDAQHIAKLW